MKKQIISALWAIVGLAAILTTSHPAKGNTNGITFSQFDVTLTSTGYLATLEFDTEPNWLYSILRSSNLLSNDWSTVVTNAPGTGTNMVVTDLTLLSSVAWFYKVTAITELNLIQNSGFEIPALAAGGTNINASGDWVQVGNNQGIQKDDWAAEEAGGQGVWLKGWTANLDQEFYQDVAGIANVEYALDAGFKFNDNFESNGSTLEMAIIWLDGGNSEISRLTLDVNANLDAPDWKHLSIVGTAPAGTVTVRAWFHWTTDSQIESSSQASALVDNVTLTAGQLGGSVESVVWGSFGVATRVAAAQYAGHYAVANSDIEINTVNESAVDTIAATEMQTLLPGAEINGLAFTSSGRQMFISANGTGSDSVLSYNAGTGVLRNFVTGLNLSSGAEKLGLAHFKGELFVGTSSGEIRRYDALLDDATGSYNGSIHFTGGDAGQPVRGIAVDIQDETLYVASPNNLYSLNPSNSVLTQIASVTGMESISFGRTYGASGQGGLVILQDTGLQRFLQLVPTADLQAGGPVSPVGYYSTLDSVADIAATACGRLLTAGTPPKMLSDSSDTRMDFMTWVADEFNQNVLLAKNLLDTPLSGMVRNHAVRDGKAWINVASPDAAYWVVNQLIMSDEVNGDPEAQGMVRDIVERFATLEVNSDGQWYHWYNATDGTLSWGGPPYFTSLFSTMKAVHMAIRAMQYYPGDPDIVDAAGTILANLRNQRDYIRDFGKQKSKADNSGPTPDTTGLFSPYIETHLFSELMAATEPMCENSYLDYWRYRDTHTYDYTLPDEPIVRHNASGFWRMYDQSTIAHCRESADWKEEFRNFHALFAGWTDDNAPEHLTAFSAGPNPDGYNADKYNNHPWTVNSFGTVIGFGLHGNTVPVVGAYFAYRDGRRQQMESATHAGANLLTRISYEDPDWLMQTLSPTDHQYAGYALGEILAPGSIDNAIAVHTYLEPQWTLEGNGDKLIEFSLTARREILATADGANWDSLGFQYSPFTVPAASPYTNFAVMGAEGELLDPSSTTATEEDYDVAADFDHTIYLVRGVTTSAAAQVRARWYNGAALISEVAGNPSGFQATKPATATILRVALVEGGTPIVADQISVVLDGVLEPFSNAGFESGDFTGWSTGSGTGMGKSVVSDARLEGTNACELTASASATNGREAWVRREYDISADAVGTHYVLEFDVLTENLEGSSIRARLEFADGTSTVFRTEYFDSYEHADSRTVLYGASRKHDVNHSKLRFQIRLRRDNATAVTANERVLVDNLRLLKMNP